MPRRVSQAEAQPAQHHQPEQDPQQRAPTERYLGISPTLPTLRFLVVEISPHAPPIND
jgi:hypothetical protein